jgi:N-acetyl-gamma-glutamyl-phosphate reductase
MNPTPSKRARGARAVDGAARLSCAVVGASGYVGAELVSLLAGHPEARLAAVQADASAGSRFGDLHPGRRQHYDGLVGRLDADALAGFDAVFLALPHGASGAVARTLLGRVGCVIDLSGDLRLSDAAVYRRWYGLEPPAPELLGKAVYGLPELFGADLSGASLVACAGCFASVVQLAAAPALGLPAAGSIGAAPAAREIFVSAVSGTSGAGRKAAIDLSFSEMTGNLRAYRVGRHQHVPEIAAGLGRTSGREIGVTFVPHIAPIGRGIFATVIVRPAGPVAPAALLEAYRAAYGGSPFVRVLDPAEHLPQISDVAGTNFCDIAPTVDASTGAFVILGAIDNLVKGAAGQAIQVMNLVFGLPETRGLIAEPRPVREEAYHA